MKLSKEEWIVFGICLVLIAAVAYFDFPKNQPQTVPQMVDFYL